MLLRDKHKQTDSALEFAERVQRMPVYPAATCYGQSTSDAPDQTILLASNESPYPPIRAVEKAIMRSLKRLNRYMDPRNTGLRERLSSLHDVPMGHIAVGNGSCDILMAAGYALLETGKEVVYGWPSFSLYEYLSAATGARKIRVPLDGEEKHDLDAMLDRITAATRLLIICNPNNPTSTAVPLSSIASFLDEVPSYVCVVVDEAYCEFNRLDEPQESVELLNRHPNLVLLRTFSKVYGLCGLRVGFALCGSEEIPRALDQVRQPFSCNAVAQTAAEEALEHPDVVADRVEKTSVERDLMDVGLRTLGLEPSHSQANFCWFHVPEGIVESELMAELNRRGVIVRGGAALGDEGALRVTYGLPWENRRFLEVLAGVL
jgi:histidinol-phosphate aminotransferase